MFYVRANYILILQCLWNIYCAKIGCDYYEIFMIVFFLGAIKLDYIDFSIEKQCDSFDAFVILRNILTRVIFGEEGAKKN